MSIIVGSSPTTLDVKFAPDKIPGVGFKREQGVLGVGAVINMIEQKIIKDSECPNCGCKESREFKRTKGEITYIVYVCKKCRYVIRRELS